MYNIRKITEDIVWLGANDRRLAKFENTYVTPEGMSYNNYLILDEKTCLVDGIDDNVSRFFLENLQEALQGRDLDYMVVNHMEPDHCAMIPRLVELYPNLTLVATGMAFKMMAQFYDLDPMERAMVVKENDRLSLGKHELSFIMAPMVHWPEVMVTYDETSKTLFSADVFGEFGCVGPTLFADEVNWEKECLAEARRYYACIVGKYGPQSITLLNKLKTKEIELICPLHGHVWRQNLELILSYYDKWTSYTPEENSVVIFYGSVYNNTANAADILGTMLVEKGLKNVKVYDTAKTDTSYLLAKAFEYSHWVMAASTYNAFIFDGTAILLDEIKHHAIKNRTVGIIENGTWSPTTGAQIQKELEGLHGMTFLEPIVRIKSSVKEENLEQFEALAQSIVDSINAL